MQEGDDLARRQLVVAEADELLCAKLVEHLANVGFAAVHAAGSAQELLQRVGGAEPDLVIIDSGLGDGEGLEACRRLRGQGFAKPVIMLTPAKGESRAIASLEAGANDYVVKPMRMRQLFERIMRQLRQHDASGAARLTLGGLVFIPGAKLLQSQDGTRRVILTERETSILKYLHTRYPGQVPREEMLSEVWGFMEGLTTHTVETHIYRLRQKMQRLTPVQVIKKTQHGYALCDEG